MHVDRHDFREINTALSSVVLLTFIEAYFNRLSGELLLALKVATVRAEALLSPDLHVKHSPLDHANM